MIAKPKILLLLVLVFVSAGCFPAGIRLYGTQQPAVSPTPAEAPVPPIEPAAVPPGKVVIIRGTVTTPSAP